MFLRERISRRRFIAMTAALAGAAAAGLGASSCEPPLPDPLVPERGRANGMPHLAWAWHFGVDGPPERMASILAQNNLGLILKTHNGCDWMSKWDNSEWAITCPGRVQILSNYFERYGIPFHSYWVAQGLDPLKEAAMCSDVLNAGARSIFVDLEPWAGYWAGSADNAKIFVQEFQRLQPNGTLHLCVEPRPWVSPRIPLDTFVPICRGIAPMAYWDTFNTSDNVNAFNSNGFTVGPQGVTPEFLLDVSQSMFAKYNLPIYPVGQGASTYDAWVRFMTRASQLNMPAVSVWRYGVTNPQVWPLLHYLTPREGVTWGPLVLTVGGRATVANTGACLNVHDTAGAYTRVIGCLFDGNVVNIQNGPVDADGYTWWLVQSDWIQGWVAQGDPSGVQWLVPKS
jgi:hypothetical protein